VNLFEFLLIVVSIVLGLGITELLEGVSRTLRGDLQWGKLHTVWVLVTFQIQVQMAWGLWGLQGRPTWRYSEFLLLLLGPVILYMAASVLFPTTDSVTADENLIQRRRPFFLLMASYVVLTGVWEPFLYDGAVMLSPTIQRAVPLVILITLSITEKRTVHWLLAPLILAGNLWWTFRYLFTVQTTPLGS
jgi:hypothetical protein